MDKTHANLGLFFQRGYYEDLTAEILTDSTKDKKNQTKYFDDRNSELNESSKRVILKESAISDTLSFKLRTVYPGLVTGIGMAHATGMEGEGKLGMAFDYTSGLPYIPGSSVKGLLRSMFPILPPNKPLNKVDEKTKELMPQKCQYICSIWNGKIMERWNEMRKSQPNLMNLPNLKEADVEKLAKFIFEGQSGDSYLSIYDRDIFFDAQIVGDYKEKGILDFDYITPHKEALKNPTPIKFLKILPNVIFVFSFKLGNSKLTSDKLIPAEAKAMLFEEILTTIGIGAKTNIGYGQLKSINE